MSINLECSTVGITCYCDYSNYKLIDCNSTLTALGSLCRGYLLTSVFVIVVYGFLDYIIYITESDNPKTKWQDNRITIINAY